MQAVRRRLLAPAAGDNLGPKSGTAAASAAWVEHSEGMWVSTFRPDQRRREVRSPRTDEILALDYHQARYAAPKHGPSTMAEVMGMEDCKKWAVIHIGGLLKIEIQSKVPSPTAGVEVTEESVLEDQVGLHTVSRWSTPEGFKFKVEQKVETGYWAPELRCLLCLRCGCRIEDRSWYSGKSAPGAAKATRCSCTGGNDLLTRPLKPRKVKGKVAHFLYRQGSTTTVYCQLARERDDNTWLSRLPLPFATKRTETPRTLAIKITEIVQQHGQKPHVTVYTGYLRICGKTAGCVKRAILAADAADAANAAKTLIQIHSDIR